MRFSVVLAARLRSSRLPAKALLPLAGVPLLVFLMRRLKSASLVERVVLATTQRQDDRHLAALAEAEGVDVCFGSEDDLIRRYLDACERFGIDYPVRVTGDCPFVDGASLDYCLAQCGRVGGFDLASTKGAFPVGIDYEVICASSLAAVYASGKPNSADREHLTKFFYDRSGRYHIARFSPPDEWSRTARTFTVDTLDDYLFCKELADRLGPGVAICDLLREAA